MPMCKHYVTLSFAKQSLAKDGKLLNCSGGAGWSVTYWPTLEAAQIKADEHARGGSVGIIYESKEYRQIQPVPVVVEKAECCG